MGGANKGQSSARNFVFGLVGGACGGILGCPFYRIKTQMQTYSSSPSLRGVGVQHSASSRGLISAFLDIGRVSGARGYFSGVSAFMPRVVIYSGVQLACYDFSKTLLIHSFQLPDGMGTHMLASSCTTLCAVTALQPFDFLAVRMMNQRVGADGKPAMYSNLADCALQTLRTEGVGGFAKGASANYARFLPYGVLQLVFFEQYKKQYRATLGQQ